MLFDSEEPAAKLDSGNLRYIRPDGCEAIRTIVYVVRDRY